MATFTEDNYAALQELFSFLTPVELTRRAGLMTNSQILRVQSDLDLWDTVKLKHVKVQATRNEGIDVDYARNRAAIRERISAHLGLDVDYTGNSATSSAALLSGLRITRG